MKDKVKITKEDLIKDIAKRKNKSISETRDFYNTLEDVIFETLLTVNEDKEICIKLFEGISLDGSFIPEKEKKNNLTGKLSYVDSKIKPKFNITRSYCEKLNSK